MELRLERWNQSEAPAQSDLEAQCSREGLEPYAWSNGPGDTYAVHSHSYDKVIYVVRGSISWILPQSHQEIETRAGDRLDLPRGTSHAARVGSDGVTCLEAHLR